MAKSNQPPLTPKLHYHPPWVVGEARPNNTIPYLFIQVTLGGLGSIEFVNSSGTDSHILELLLVEFVPSRSPVVSQSCPNGAFHLGTVPLLLVKNSIIVSHPEGPERNTPQVHLDRTLILETSRHALCE
jgi:hypothetical protein